MTGFFLSKPCHIDKLRLAKYADEFLTTLQSGLSKTSQKVVKYVSHNALLNSERGSNVLLDDLLTSFATETRLDKRKLVVLGTIEMTTQNLSI